MPVSTLGSSEASLNTLRFNGRSERQAPHHFFTDTKIDRGRVDVAQYPQNGKPDACTNKPC